MWEMQSIQLMHCTIWSEGIREIVSAESSNVKFLISDHPVTVYNYSMPPDTRACSYPNDPSISLKASQTIFPLSRNLCLILTNLEYAREPEISATAKRTFARNFRRSLTRTDAFIRTRKLSPTQVQEINFIVKSRARRFIAAGRKEWLHPEKEISANWDDMRQTLMPPECELWRFGGQIFTKFESGHVHYQDEFGRTEEPRRFLLKNTATKTPEPRAACGCGSGRRYRDCCLRKPSQLRPTWTELSIRERNLLFFKGIAGILDFTSGKDWLAIRRDLTDEQIKDVYRLFEALWPTETDLLQMLPKPDGTFRAVYTGVLDPNAISNFAMGLTAFVSELIVEHPFIHAGILRKEYSPTENPHAYRQEFIKSVAFLIKVIPLVERGLINLVPNPSAFDEHLRRQMMSLARLRTTKLKIDPNTMAQAKDIFDQDFKRGMLSLPKDQLRIMFRKRSPELSEQELDEMLTAVDTIREEDPLAPLQECLSGGQFNLMKMAPNFEMAMYLAQATGACIVTDSAFRWQEIQLASGIATHTRNNRFSRIKTFIETGPYPFLQHSEELLKIESDSARTEALVALGRLFNHLSKHEGVAKPNYLQSLNARLSKALPSLKSRITSLKAPIQLGRVYFTFPEEGIQDNTINRLLLMSSSEHHLPSVPMALFIERL
jgi:hypothetical protein